MAVYNLEVEQAHTYFVLAEDANDAAAVWVHNASYSNGTATPLHPRQYSVLYETEISAATLAKRNRYAHFKEANANLLNDVQAGSALDTTLGTMLPGYRARISAKNGGVLGVSPDIGATWHHVPELNKLQLVLRYQHEQNSSQTSRLFQSLFHRNGKGGYATGG